MDDFVEGLLLGGVWVLVVGLIILGSLGFFTYDDIKELDQAICEERF